MMIASTHNAPLRLGHWLALWTLISSAPAALAQPDSPIPQFPYWDSPGLLTHAGQNLANTETSPTTQYPQPPHAQRPAIPPAPPVPQYPEAARTEDEAADENTEQADDKDYVTDEEYDDAKAKDDEVARDVEYGEAGSDYTQSFLRSQSPLLSPGQTQWDYGLQYSVLESDFPIVSGTRLTEENVTIRQLVAPLSVRRGVTDRLQWFASMPFVWQETDSFDGSSNLTGSAANIGDLVTGFNYLLRPESRSCASIIASWDLTLPTGNPIDPLLLTDTGTGSGVWATSANFLMVRTLDPVVAFWGGGYRFTFENEFRGTDIDLGDQIRYTCGIGFAANENVTLSTALIGARVTDFRINGNRIDGSTIDQISVRLAATIARCQKIREPFVEFGITERAPQAVLGIVLTH